MSIYFHDPSSSAAPTPADAAGASRNLVPSYVGPSVIQNEGEPLATGTCLATVVYGASAMQDVRWRAPQGLVFGVPLEPIGGVPRVERWQALGPVERGSSHGFDVARTECLAFGVSTFDPDAVEESAFDVYSRLAQWLQHSGHSLTRIWNVVPNIHGGSAAFDRYMQFCRGRARAFEAAWGEGFEEGLPACSAVGSHSGPALLYFLSSTDPSEHRENPRQVSAYRYPERYGPRSPSFARATAGSAAAGGWLYLSGTASIVGHETVHAGDVRAQTLETIRNLRVLVHGECEEHRTLSGSIRAVKVYVRHLRDVALVKALVQSEIGAEEPCLVVHADICRADLLVEIEGVACRRDLEEPS